VGRTDRRGSVPRSVLKGFPMAGSKSAVALASGIATASAGIATASAAATASALKSASDYVPVPRRIGRGVFGGSDETIEEDEGEELDEATINRSELAGGRFVGGRFATTPPPGSAEFKRKSSGMASEKTMSASEGDMSGKLSEKMSDVAGSSVEGGSSSLEGVEEALEEERSTSQVDDESLDAATVVSERASRLGYNPSRIPSWCDREQTGYHAVTAVDTSDHTPVCATFAVQVMLPSDAESHGTGDLYQWELSIASVAIAIPLSALDDDDAMAAKVPDAEIEPHHPWSLRFRFGSPSVVPRSSSGRSTRPSSRSSSSATPSAQATRRRSSRPSSRPSARAAPSGSAPSSPRARWR
jgi:hypothetical protein